ncbi:MAG: hypothetical protein ACW99Q_08465 [Candidatus Kariarchaeaceae archaeon]|jgi:hypothetical protein
MSQAFMHDNIVAGILVLIIGFGFHWIGQVISVSNWEYATEKGLQEEGLLPEYKVYENAIAKADAAMGWLYGIAGIGLILNADWGYKLAWIPAAVFVYHGISFWFWTDNQRKLGHRLSGDALRIGWTLMNLVSGLITMLVAWNAT